MMNISSKFEISTYNTLSSGGPTKFLAESRKNARGSHLVFQNEAKNIPRQDLMAMNISCKFEKSSYNIFLFERERWNLSTHYGGGGSIRKRNPWYPPDAIRWIQLSYK